MKNNIYLLVIILLNSCIEISYKTSIEELNKGIEVAADLNYAEKYRSEAKTGFYHDIILGYSEKQNSERLKQYSPRKYRNIWYERTAINQSVYQLCNTALNKNKRTEDSLHYYQDTIVKVNISAKEKEKLISEILKYKTYLLSICKNDSQLLKIINKNLNIQKIETTNISLSSQLYLIIANINYIESCVFRKKTERLLPFYRKEISFKPVIFKNRNILKKGDFFKAEIFVVKTDTVPTYKIVIGNDTILAAYNEIVFRKKVNKVGRFTFKGILLVPFCKKCMYLKYPFSYQYKVIR